MMTLLFEPFREWTDFVRRRKGSKKPTIAYRVVGARIRCVLYKGHRGVAREISRNSERALAQFMLELRSRLASWLNLKQLQEPHGVPSDGAPREFISTSRS